MKKEYNTLFMGWDGIENWAGASKDTKWLL